MALCDDEPWCTVIVTQCQCEVIVNEQKRVEKLAANKRKLEISNFPVMIKF